VQLSVVGKGLEKSGITEVLCSPMIRCVQSGSIVCDELGFGPTSLCVEIGLTEEAKSFRGKTSDEPRPCWTPLVLSSSELVVFSDKIDPSYVSLLTIEYKEDYDFPNGVSELHATLPVSGKKEHRDEISRQRIEEVLRRIVSDEALKDEVVLLVAHGATVKYMSQALQAKLSDEKKIKGERDTSCFAGFRPNPSSPELGSWLSMTESWQTGNVGAGPAKKTVDEDGGV
jgi:broad specificity phosphatase PhoE